MSEKFKINSEIIPTLSEVNVEQKAKETITAMKVLLEDKFVTLDEFIQNLNSQLAKISIDKKFVEDITLFTDKQISKKIKRAERKKGKIPKKDINELRKSYQNVFNKKNPDLEEYYNKILLEDINGFDINSANVNSLDGTIYSIKDFLSNGGNSENISDSIKSIESNFFSKYVELLNELKIKLSSRKNLSDKLDLKIKAIENFKEEKANPKILDIARFLEHYILNN